MIVAGGAGTRLKPLTETTPKPLLPFCGAPFLSGVVRRLAAAGIERVLLVVGADTGPFEPLAASMRRHGVAVETVPEPEPLDTAGGVRAALDRVAGTFLVLNGDVLTDVDLPAVVDAHRTADAGATLVLTRVEDTSSYGVCVREGRRIVAFVEKPAPGTLPGQDAVNAGTYVLEPSVLERFPVGRLSFEREVFPRLVDDGVHVEGVVSDAVWADLGTPDRMLDGHRLALDGALAWPTLADVPDHGDGVRLDHDVEVAADAVLRGPVLLRSGARVEAGATIGPHTVVDHDAHVGAGATVRDSVLGPAARVAADAMLVRVLTGPDATIGTGARLEAGAVLGAGAHVAAGAVLSAGARVVGGNGA
jgi:mannose-1-phosphate guanylyltransferase